MSSVDVDPRARECVDVVFRVVEVNCFDTGSQRVEKGDVVMGIED
jgi:hypothetical protein